MYVSTWMGQKRDLDSLKQYLQVALNFMWDLGTKPESLQEQQMLSTSESSPQPQKPLLIFLKQEFWKKPAGEAH